MIVKVIIHQIYFPRIGEAIMNKCNSTVRESKEI